MSDILRTIFAEGLRRVTVEQDPQEVTDWAIRQLLSTRSGAPEKDPAMDIPQSIEFYQDVLQKREDFFNLPIEERRQMLFPWQSWNRMIDPLPPGVLMNISGEDGVGKTTYAENIVEWYAKNGYKVVFFHFELSHEVMMDRRMSRWSGMTVTELKNQLSEAQRKERDRADRTIGSWGGNIEYVHCPGWTYEQVVQEAHRWRGEGKCQVFVVDYLEKFGVSSRQARLYPSALAREADNVEQMKNLAEQMGVPAIILSQFNKSGKDKPLEELTKTDIRGAGEKTEKANVVVLMKSDTMPDGSLSNVVNIRIAKNTLGPMGTIKQIAKREVFRIADAVWHENVPLDGPGRLP